VTTGTEVGEKKYVVKWENNYKKEKNSLPLSSNAKPGDRSKRALFVRPALENTVSHRGKICHTLRKKKKKEKERVMPAQPEKIASELTMARPRADGRDQVLLGNDGTSAQMQRQSRLQACATHKGQRQWLLRRLVTPDAERSRAGNLKCPPEDVAPSHEP